MDRVLTHGYRRPWRGGARQLRAKDEGRASADGRRPISRMCSTKLPGHSDMVANSRRTLRVNCWY